MTASNASTELFRFRHSGYAAVVRAYLNDQLVTARAVNEGNPVSEENRMRVLAVQDVITALFGE